MNTLNELSDALEPFCLLAKTSKGRAAVSLIHQAISAPHTFFFGELLGFPNIQELDSQVETKGAIELLRVFAYGNYQDYKKCLSVYHLDPLTAQQLLKLRLLTIVSLSSENKTLGYERLMMELELSNVRELEDLIIDGIYCGLFKGKLDHAGKQFLIQEAVGRDLKPGDLERTINKLKQWRQHCDNVLAMLATNADKAIRDEQMDCDRMKAFEEHVETVKRGLQSKGSSIGDERGGKSSFSGNSDYYNNDEEVKRPKRDGRQMKGGGASASQETRRQ